MESLLHPGRDNQICPTQRCAVRETDGNNSGQVTYVLTKSLQTRACRMVQKRYVNDDFRYYVQQSVQSTKQHNCNLAENNAQVE